jgi:hypothetical protein
MSYEPSDIFLDPSYAQTLTQYSGATVSLETLVWQRYVGINNIDVSQPLTDGQKAAFLALVKQYQGWGLTIDDLTGTSVQPASSNYMSCYVLAANLFPGITTIQTKDMWNGFLRTYSLTSAQAQEQDLSALFTNYLKSLYTNAVIYDSLPPSEQQVVAAPEDVYQIELWNRFLSIHGYSAQDTTSSDIEEQFEAFVQQYKVWNVSLEALQSTNSLPSGSGSEFFIAYLNGFYGQMSSEEKTDLWNQFLLNNSLSSNPTDLSALKQPFVDFINGLQAKKGAYEAQTTSSPNATIQAGIFNAVMASLQKMLNASEGVVINAAATLNIYSKWQEIYTEEMTRAPNISAVPASQISTSKQTTLQLPAGTDPSKWDLTTYTFGYDNISLQDVIKWAYGTLTSKANTQTSVTFGNPTSPMGAYTFSLVQNSEGKQCIQETFDFYLKDPTYRNDIAYPRSTYGYDKRPDLYTHVTQSTTVPVEDANGFPLIDSLTGTFYTSDDMVKQLSTGFCSIFSALSTQYPYSSDPTYSAITNLQGQPNDPTNPYNPAGLQGRYLGGLTTYVDDDGNTQIDSTQEEERTAQNAIIQQYVNNIRAQRTVVQNTTQQIQTLLQSSKTAINNISSLWTSILQAIQTIVTTLYEKTNM